MGAQISLTRTVLARTVTELTTSSLDRHHTRGAGLLLQGLDGRLMRNLQFMIFTYPRATVFQRGVGP